MFFKCKSALMALLLIKKKQTIKNNDFPKITDTEITHLIQ